MSSSVYFLLIAFLACGTANRVYPPTKAIKISLGVSKAAYLPLRGNKFIRNGGIVENSGTVLPRFLFGFIPLPPKYDPAKDKIACSIRGWTAKSYEHKETEVLMFTNVQQKLVVFGFRGTEAFSLRDWAKDFYLIPLTSTIGKTTFTTHRGFAYRYSFIAAWFEREYSAVPRDYTIVITGHSLGGAEANFAAVYAAAKLKRRPDAVITYGSPFVGQNNFKNYYNQVVGCNRTLRIAAKCDIITFPLMVFGYTHVCDGVEVDGKTGYNLLKAHDLYGGYEQGIARKYKNVNEINFGCDQKLN